MVCHIIASLYLSSPDRRFRYRYSTGSDLNTYSALIQNFYSGETAPHQSVHLALDTGVQEGGQLGVKAFVRSVLSLFACLKIDC